MVTAFFSRKHTTIVIDKKNININIYGLPADIRRERKKSAHLPIVPFSMRMKLKIMQTRKKNVLWFPSETLLTCDMLSYTPLKHISTTASRLGHVMLTVIQRYMVGIHIASALTPSCVRFPDGCINSNIKKESTIAIPICK
jgi:hypothetical protein